MGALNMAGAGAYGFTRGGRDARKDEMEAEGFQTDQAIRKQRLEDEQAAAPVRRRALNYQLSAAEKQDKASGLALEQATGNAADVKEAKDKEKKLNIALGNFYRSGDPQHVADAVNEIYPNSDGKGTAVRNEDGSITINGPKMQKPITFANKKVGGEDRTPDDQFAMYVYHMLNPVAAIKDRQEVDYAKEKEGVKQEGATQRAIIGANSRVQQAEARADAERERSSKRGVDLGKKFVDSSLKTVSVPGNFAAAYSSDDDAKLLPHMYNRMGELVRKDDKEPEQASEQAIREVRVEFLGQKKKALDAAARLKKSGVDPKDRDALAKARAAGNKDVDEYLAALGAAKKRFGDDIGNYLLEQVPTGKK